MADVASSSTTELLQYLHKALDAHFTQLRDARTASTEQRSPVFALEHDLPPEDLHLLKDTVRGAVREGLGARHRAWWLPFVVYAAESGYDYVGEEYWRTFEQTTPGWRDDQRHWIKAWFEKFAIDYDGAVPTGAFAGFFKIIAWPITHAVLPTYLQRQLAQLIYDFSGALTSELLDDPEELGSRLARRATNYTERFRIFCDNTTLVGKVAAALLSGENEPTPYLSASTLTRIVDGLSAEQQSRHWLKSARQSANRVRGFRSSNTSRPAAATSTRLPRPTDPRLFLRFDGVWGAYTELPDLTILSDGLPDIYSQLRSSRASVNGGARPIPPSGLLYPGQEMRFSRWPLPDQPFLQLDRADERANRVLADQCVITTGPWWLFRRQGTGLAIEVKSKFVRPGHRYVLVGADTLGAPSVPWCVDVVIGVQDAAAYEFRVPPQLSEREEAALRSAGLTVVPDVAIRPVGLTASAWDGEGEVEWPAGEPAMLGIRSDLLPSRCRVTVDGAVHFLDWPEGETELLFGLEGLPVGAHELDATLLGDDGLQIADGSLVITIRDPQVRAEGASAGEGIRLLASPTRPTLSDLWDGRAVVTIDGPSGTEADLGVTLRNGRGEWLAEVRRGVRLPLAASGWRATAKSVRDNTRFSDAYDGAESCTVTVARDGVGFAVLSCERGFQPLRWWSSRNRNGHVVATLVDRTDGGTTTVDFYDVETPMTAIPKDPTQPFDVPTRGGLAIAMAAGAVAAAILPTNPNALLRLSQASPTIYLQTASSKEVLRLAQGHRRWIEAELPADAFAIYERQIVCNAIARAISTLISGSHWAAVERKLASAKNAIKYLDTMQNAVGVTAEHKALASTIAYSLYKWLKPEDLLSGFHDVIGPHLAGHGITGQPSTPRFLLTLAGRPGHITEWEPDERMFLLNQVLKSPVLYRAARFAVLGTRALNDDEGTEGGF